MMVKIPEAGLIAAPEAGWAAPAAAALSLFLSGTYLLGAAMMTTGVGVGSAAGGSVPGAAGTALGTLGAGWRWRGANMEALPPNPPAGPFHPWLW